jgi:zinc transport system substrate-binding protein
MKGKILMSILATLLLAALLLPLSCTSSPVASADIMAGSSLIANIIQDVADGKLEARTLVPPGMCPGHYDVKPSDIETLTNSKALIIHNWQQDKANIKGLIEAADNPGLIIKVIDVPDAPMVPEVQAEAVDKIAQALCDIDPENSAYYQQRAEERIQVSLIKGEEVKNRLQEAKVSEVEVICSDMQAGFVKWAGFDVMATYGRPEDLSVAEMERLVNQAKQAGVALVIDTLQSGGTATSETMAQDIGATQVTISNFPGGFKGTETWEKTIDKNVDLIFEALAQWRQQYG